MAIEYGNTTPTRVEIAGELDIANHAALRRVMYAVLEDCVRILVDLRDLRFVDLPGVRLLVEVAAAAERCGCQLQLANPHGEVARVLDLASARALLPLA